MPRLELILLHSASAGGYNAGRLLSATTSRFMASAFVFMAFNPPSDRRPSAKDRKRDELVF
jgi:hypothetical protein